MENQRSAHITEERLEAYSSNLLGGDELDHIEEHLLVCGTCQDRLQAVERFEQAMRSAARCLRKEEKDAPDIQAWYRTIFHVPLPVCAGIGVAIALAFMAMVRVPTPRSSHTLPVAGAPVDVALESVRGESTGTALAGHALHLRLDGEGVAEIPVWNIEIVDSEGGKVWSGSGIRSDSTITADVPQAFSPGTYYVRLIKDSAVDPAREFELVVK